MPICQEEVPIHSNDISPSVSADPAEAVRQIVRQCAGQRLPSERDLSAQLHISRPRLRAILAGLRAEGLIEPRLGSGTYAVDQQPGRLNRVVLLIDARLKLGDDPFFSHLVEALQAQLQAEGARCLIERIGDQDLASALPPLEDGALTLGRAGETVLAAQRPADPPLVGLLLGEDARPGRRASVFQLDDRGAGRDAARRPLSEGCREFLFVGRRDIAASRERLAGAEEIITAEGGRLHFVECHLNYAAGLMLGRTLPLPPGTTPLGLIAANDWLAAGLQAGLCARNEARARQVRLVSFDGLPMTANPALGIASLVVPIEAIARDAIAELHRLGRSPASAGRAVRYPLHWPDSE